MTETIHLRGPRGSAVIDPATGTVLHWGAPLEAEDLPGLRTAVTPAVPEAGLDDPVPLTLAPEEGSGFPSRPAVTGRRPDGTAWSPRFHHVEHSADGDALTIRSQDPVAGLRLEVTAVLSGDVLRVSLRLTNTGDTPYLLDGLVATLPLPAHADEVLHFTGRWCREWQEQRTPVGVGALVQENRRGRTSHDNPPGLVVGTPGFGERHGEVWGAHLGWSGNHQFRVERLATGQVFLQAGELLMPGEVTLAPGESYETPGLYAAYSGDGLGSMSAAFHTFLRSRPAHPASPRPVLINTWEAVYFDHDLDRLRSLADSAAELGVERFVLDDGWFLGRRDDSAGLGDWYVDPVMYPDGLTPLIDHVRSLGMEFGLWVEPEMVNPDSDLLRAHPDWALTTAGYDPLTFRRQLVLDLGRPEAFAHILERLDALLSEYDIAYLKWDMNRDLVQASGADGTAGVRAQTLAYYALVDALRARHPGVEIESCSSGGARADFAVLERTQRIWTSDCNDAHERQSIQRGFSYFFPPEVMGAHIGPPRAHTTGRVHDLEFRVATALFGHLGIEWDVTAAGPGDREVIAGAIAAHRRLRPLLHSGTVVRLDGLSHGAVAADRSAALFAFVQTAADRCTGPAPLRLAGLDPERSYRVRRLAPGAHGHGPAKSLPLWLAEGAVLTGRQLAAHGLAMPLLNPDHVLLVECAAV
ncbi:alpha-galactosidase [Wenjunlia tyrosinilytica]|uniref:Alpha-galactosidase n=1 Tax=Wenjunlia tyrosinilytica TaxID=1544741 RepID=A0A917ZVQ3_9ACTN|nr:alpha-galactosidase [Wenjunlia tyrosinilytica]GGO96162.1 alpha-galactosidase [Wenjunlia tyrosinilytica]